MQDITNFVLKHSLFFYITIDIEEVCELIVVRIKIDLTRIHHKTKFQ